MLTKLDLKKDLKHLYNPSAKDFSVVEVPPMRFLMIDGEGDPNTSQAYTDAVGALFGVAYAIKFAVKKEGLVDTTVMPLEGLWWAEDMTQFNTDDKSNWLWTVMVAQPDVVTEAHVEAALAVVRAGSELAATAGQDRRLAIGERDAAIVFAAEEGLAIGSIARAVGMETKVVRNLIRRRRDEAIHRS